MQPKAGLAYDPQSTWRVQALRCARGRVRWAYVLKLLARGIAASTVFVALAAAGPAAGGDPAKTRYSADFKYGDGTISFVRREANRPKVARIRIKGMLADCEGSNVAVSYRIFGKTRVLSDRSFAVRSEDGEGGKAVVRGEFSRGARRVNGTARVHGLIKLSDGSRVSCESGKQAFKATISG